MISTLASIVAHSFAGLTWLSTPEIVAAVGILAYAVGGLAFVLTLTGRPDPVPRSQSRAPAFTRSGWAPTAHCDPASAERERVVASVAR